MRNVAETGHVTASQRNKRSNSVTVGSIQQRGEEMASLVMGGREKEKDIILDLYFYPGNLVYPG
jgi:hypothetical protein